MKLLRSKGFAKRPLLLLSVCLIRLTTPAISSAQNNTDTMRFEVASIRPASSNDGRPSIQFLPGGGIKATNATVKLLIEAAYSVREDQVIDGEDWLDHDQFVVTAKAPESQSKLSGDEATAATLKRLQNLLADRFALVFKQETKRQSGYALTVDKTGTKMEAAMEPSHPMLRQSGRWQITAQGVTMSVFIAFLGVHLHESVDDQTGLTGHYNFSLNWMPDAPQPMGTPEDSLGPAMKEQLGLKLTRQKVEVPLYIIQSASKPTEN